MATSSAIFQRLNQADSLTSAREFLRFPSNFDVPDSYRRNSSNNDLETDMCLEPTAVLSSAYFTSQNHHDSRRSNQNSMPSSYSLPGFLQHQQLQRQQNQVQESTPDINDSRRQPREQLQNAQPIQQQFRLFPEIQHSEQNQTATCQGQPNAQGIQRQQQSSLYQGNLASSGSDDNKSLNLENSRYPHYKQTAVRRSTFNSWPSRLKPSKLMAEAGFFSAKTEDSVRCYHCGIGLRNWDPEDDPWVEHARWSPNCQYVQHVRGQDFINLVQAAVRQAEMQEALKENASLCQPKAKEQSKVDDVQEDGRRLPRSAESGNVVKHSSKFTAEERKNPLQTSCAQSVLAMGYRPKTILKAIERVVENKGWDSLSGESIMMVIFDMEENGEISSIEEDKVDDTKQTKEQGSSDSTTTDLADRTHLMAENEELKDRTRCKICCENPVSIVFLPCGHLVCCAQCAPALKKCAICRKGIKGTVRVCLS